MATDDHTLLHRDLAEGLLFIICKQRQSLGQSCRADGRDSMNMKFKKVKKRQSIKRHRPAERGHEQKTERKRACRAPSVSDALPGASRLSPH